NSGGIVQIRHVNGLGSSTTATTVGTNSQLQVFNPGAGAFTVVNNLNLNGPGISNDGALLLPVGSGSVTWDGSIELDSDATIGANVPLTLAVGLNTAASLNITGTVSDLGSGHNLTKE